MLRVRGRHHSHCMGQSIGRLTGAHVSKRDGRPEPVKPRKKDKRHTARHAVPCTHHQHTEK